MASYDYPAYHRALEITAIVTFFALAATNAWTLALAIDGVPAVLVTVAAALTGYLAADLISGVVHWLADRYGTAETPIFGPNFVRTFREHHVTPTAIAEHDWIETNGDNCIVSFWVLALGLLVEPAAGELGALYGLGVILFSMLAIMATNQFHSWAHAARVPRLVAWLQRYHIVLSPEHHDEHHHAPYDRRYCITTGWLNHPLDRVGFFAGAERRIERWLGIRAGVDDAEVTGSAQRGS